MTLLLPLLTCPMHFPWEGPSSRYGLIRMAEKELRWKTPSLWLVSSCNSMPLLTPLSPRSNLQVQSNQYEFYQEGHRSHPPKQSSVWSFSHFSGPGLQKLDTGSGKTLFESSCILGIQKFFLASYRELKSRAYVFKGMLPAGPSHVPGNGGKKAIKGPGEPLWRPVPQEARSPAEPAKDVNHFLNSLVFLSTLMY